MKRLLLITLLIGYIYPCLLYTSDAADESLPV